MRRGRRVPTKGTWKKTVRCGEGIGHRAAIHCSSDTGRRGTNSSRLQVRAGWRSLSESSGELWRSRGGMGPGVMQAARWGFLGPTQQLWWLELEGGAHTGRLREAEQFAQWPWGRFLGPRTPSGERTAGESRQFPLGLQVAALGQFQLRDWWLLCPPSPFLWTKPRRCPYTWAVWSTAWGGGPQLGAPYPVSTGMMQRYWAKLNCVGGTRASQSREPWALHLLGAEVSRMTLRLLCHHGIRRGRDHPVCPRCVGEEGPWGTCLQVCSKARPPSTALMPRSGPWTSRITWELTRNAESGSIQVSWVRICSLTRSPRDFYAH